MGTGVLEASVSMMTPSPPRVIRGGPSPRAIAALVNSTAYGVYVANIPAALIIQGETFPVEVHDRRFFVTHPQWSLMGAGDSLPEAHNQLLIAARDLANAMADDDDAMLSAEAKRLRAFAMQMR